MGVFHVFQIVHMIPNRAKRLICFFLFVVALILFILKDCVTNWRDNTFELILKVLHQKIRTGSVK